MTFVCSKKKAETANSRKLVGKVRKNKLKAVWRRNIYLYRFRCIPSLDYASEQKSRGKENGTEQHKKHAS